MFERRLKIMLVDVAMPALLLIGRAAQVQIAGRAHWKHEAAEAMKLSHLIETTRGNVTDRKGRLLAVDKPCIDACLDYRAPNTTRLLTA